LAFHFGTGEYENLDELLALLKPFDIKIVYTDHNLAYQLRVTNSEVGTGKEKTQKIERKHLSLRTWCFRLVRKDIGFSRDHGMHKIVVALVIIF
jgi:insertion element IS1 protein InsB